MPVENALVGPGGVWALGILPLVACGRCVSWRSPFRYGAGVSLYIRRNSFIVQSACSWWPWSRLPRAPIGSGCPLGLPPPPQLQSVVVSPSSSYHVLCCHFAPAFQCKKKENIHIHIYIHTHTHTHTSIYKKKRGKIQQLKTHPQTKIHLYVARKEEAEAEAEAEEKGQPHHRKVKKLIEEISHIFCTPVSPLTIIHHE